MAEFSGLDQRHGLAAWADFMSAAGTLFPITEAIIETVMEGGDTDTNAAICGALLGAAHGRDALPARWRNLVLSCRTVDADDVRHPRPADYWPDDALELAEALLTSGVS